MDEILSRKPSRRLPKPVLAGTGVLLVTGAAWLLFSTTGVEIAAKDVRTSTVQNGPLTLSVAGFGHFTTNQSVAQVLPFNAVVTEVLRHNGDTVVAGELVLRLSNPTLENELAGKNSELKLEQLAADEMTLQNAQREQELAQAQRQARARFHIAELELQANQKLLKNKVISHLQYEQSKMAFNLAADELAVSEQNLQRHQQQQQQQQSINQEKIRLRQLAVDKLLAEQQQLEVRAGKAGTLSGLQVQVGQSVPMSTVLFLLNAQVPNLARVKFAQSYQSDLKPGLLVKLSYAGGLVDGTLARLNPVIEEGFIGAEVELLSAPADIRLEMSLKAEAILEQLPTVRYVSTPSYLANRPNQQSGSQVPVFVREDHRLIRRMVEVVRQTTDHLLLADASLVGKDIVVSDVSQYLQYAEVTVAGRTN